jgi:hypothetical protein
MEVLKDFGFDEVIERIAFRMGVTVDAAQLIVTVFEDHRYSRVCPSTPSSLISASRTTMLTCVPSGSQKTLRQSTTWHQKGYPSLFRIQKHICDQRQSRTDESLTACDVRNELRTKHGGAYRLRRVGL